MRYRGGLREFSQGIPFHDGMTELDVSAALAIGLLAPRPKSAQSAKGMACVNGTRMSYPHRVGALRPLQRDLGKWNGRGAVAGFPTSSWMFS
jgi:hypothetical protein